MPLEVEGIDYRPEAVEDVRTNIVIPARDEALKQMSFDWAAGLTHTVAYLAYLKEMLEERAAQPEDPILPTDYVADVYRKLSCGSLDRDQLRMRAQHVLDVLNEIEDDERKFAATDAQTDAEDRDQTRSQVTNDNSNEIQEIEDHANTESYVLRVDLTLDQYSAMISAAGAVNHMLLNASGDDIAEWEGVKRELETIKPIRIK